MDDERKARQTGSAGDGEDPRDAAMRWIREDLAAMPIDGAVDACWYLARAARLKALGDANLFDDWTSDRRLTRHGDLASALGELARHGRWDLQHAEGVILGRALIDANDFHVLRVVDEESGGLLASARRQLQAWAEDAEEVLLDDDAAAEVRAFGDLHPLPEKYLLESMHDPLGGLEHAILLRLPHEPVMELRPIVFEAEYALDRGVPTDHMITRVAERRGRIDLADGAWLSVSGDLSRKWELSLLVESIDGGPRGLDHVLAARVGGFSLSRREPRADPILDHWSIDLTRMNADVRAQLLNHAIGIRMADGRRFVL